MNLHPLRSQLMARRQDQVEWGRKMARRRWIRKPTRPTQARYLRLLAALEDGTLDEAGTVELTRLLRKMPAKVRAGIERRGLALELGL